jgi:hypothetical protein
MSIEAMKQALSALEELMPTGPATAELRTNSINALRQAIEQAEQQTHTDHPMRHWDRTCPACVAEAEKQEPVAWMTNSEQDVTVEFLFSHVQTPMHKIPLYTTPPKREWVGLTAEEIYNCWQSAVDENGFTKRKVYDAIEAKLKEKNT